MTTPEPILPHLHLSPRQPLDADLVRVVVMAVQGAGRRSAHRGDRMMAEAVAARIIAAIQEANYTILRTPVVASSRVSGPNVTA